MIRDHDDGSLDRLMSRYRRSASELRPLDVSRDTGPGKLLLTGASGFFGRSLVKQIARSMPDREIYCLVRDESSFRSGLNGSDGVERIHPLVGNLALPSLGLSTRDWTRLGRDVDVIVHAGALVNHFLPLERMVETNVSGTLALLRLAGEHRNKRMHFISTLSSLGQGDARYESDRLPPAPPPGGYAQSKWLAERLIEICRAAGFEVSTYRVGGLGPNTETGEVNVEDSRWLVMRAALESGCRPDCPGGPRWLPVDVAARMVANVIAHEPDPAVTYHLAAPTGPTWQAVFEEMISLGHALEKVDRQAWFGIMRNRARLRDETSLKVLALRLPRQAESQRVGRNLMGGTEPVGGVHPRSWKPGDLPVTIRWATERGHLQARAACFSDRGKGEA